MYIFTYVFLDIYTQSHAHARAHTYTHAYFKLISSSNQYKLAKFSFYEINQFGRYAIITFPEMELCTMGL